jgi:uncharacterized protein YjbJ (UPF0337 family)
MNKDQIKGTVENVKGEVNEAVGRVRGNTKRRSRASPSKRRAKRAGIRAA